MARETKKDYEKEARRIIGELSVTGMLFAEVSDILLDEYNKLPPLIQNQLIPTLRRTGGDNQAILEDGIIADVEKDEERKKYLRERLFSNDADLLNCMMYWGASHIIEKMQAEAVKHTHPNRYGVKFDMFHAIQHNSIYFPNDVELLHRHGYEFDRVMTLNGKQVDFTQYNLNTLKEENDSFEKNVNGLYSELQRVLPQYNALIEQYQKLEQEKQTASATRQRTIDREMERINKNYVKLMEKATTYWTDADIDSRDFISCRQRLLKAVELRCISPKNIQKIQNANIDGEVQRLQNNYAFFAEMKKLFQPATASNSEQQQHIANAKPITEIESSNNTLAKAANNEPIDKTNIPAVQKQQLGTIVNPENDDLVMNQTQQATNS